MIFNFCITQGVVFAVLSWKRKALTHIKVWPVRSRLMRGLVCLLSLNKNLVKW